MPRRSVAVLLTIALTGASVSAFPWIRDMWAGPVVLPHTLPMVPPDDVLGVDGPQIMNRLDARTKLSNPLPASAAVLARGAELFRIYCAACHGATAGGDGIVAGHFRRMPDLNAPHVQNYPDGWLYTIIREGGFNMPPFAFALDVDERWAIVHHIRTFAPDP